MERKLAQPWMETAASPEALAIGREREASAQTNEAEAVLILEWLAIVDLRMIVAIYGRVFPIPTDDRLAYV